MPRTTSLLLLLLLPGCGAASAVPASAGPSRARVPPELRVAITVDDLPSGGDDYPGVTRVDLVKQVVRTLVAHHVPRAVGFVVGAQLAAHPEREAAIDAWVAAGFEVGSHSYSHDQIEPGGVAHEVEDILRNRALVNALELRTGQKLRYFRFPYLEEGPTREGRAVLRDVLDREGYTLARASVTFGDTDWADAYARCQERGDGDSLAALRASYLENAVAALGWSEYARREVVGRRLPLILLLHPTISTASYLDALLTAYERLGVRWVPVEEALREPEYLARYEQPGGNLFAQICAKRGVACPPNLVEPNELIDRICQ